MAPSLAQIQEWDRSPPQPIATDRHQNSTPVPQSRCCSAAPCTKNGARLHHIWCANRRQEGHALSAFCMALGQAMGLQVADAEILTAGGRQVLLVRRYDRRRDQQRQWLRLHQKDFCQALGVPPELKYQNEGGPDLQACFGCSTPSSATTMPRPRPENGWCAWLSSFPPAHVNF